MVNPIDVIKIMLCRGDACSSNSNATNTTEEYTLDVNRWLTVMNDQALFMMAGAAAMTGVVILLGMLHLIFVISLIRDEQIRSEIYWLVLMPPVISVCGFVGIVLPRAALFMYSVALVYYMICIFVLVLLMNTLNGSRKLMCRKLMDRGERISIRFYPFTCCLFCCDRFPPTVQNFRSFEMLVLQSPIVRILLEILNITVFMELNSRKNMYFQISNGIGIISMLIGSYGSYVIVPLGALLLHEYRFLLLFRIVDFCQLFWSLQKFVADLLGIFDLVPKISKEIDLPSSMVAQFYTCFLLCVEMLLVAVIVTVCFQPSRCAFFDRFRYRTGESLGECIESRLIVSGLENVMFGAEKGASDVEKNGSSSAKDEASDAKADGT